MACFDERTASTLCYTIATPTPVVAALAEPERAAWCCHGPGGHGLLANAGTLTLPLDSPMHKSMDA